MNLNTKYHNKDILILGFGKTGNSIARFLKKYSFNIFIYDDNKDLQTSLAKKYKIFFPTKKKLSDFYTIFVSPGISEGHFLVKEAKYRNIMLSNDIELFLEFKNFKRINAFVVGITGTNGKSTIALLISRALQTIPLGNFGNPILDNLNLKNNFVIELSSFQLQYINKFKPNISIISNIQIDHLNYHRTFKNT